ncbi:MULTISPECIES: hypothetical protein [Chryseobacterium]|uniref:Uncharacterized protein n=1 Tax=Chryseobacterium salivictor TaxID=2547600 RepID=A0A4P6ZFS2_9FLAO|nr:MULTISPECIES: hypothetical protein [Chryseobacterium]MDQ0477989.1 di/tricarboxylate transporter [Chryseobacterium sp. MDT2-18]QBO58461.1 hypothetical protein NBC122_01646 [Chryseobacterium salivictor]
MTRTNLFSKIQIFALAVMANFAVVLVKAQEKASDLKVDVDVNKGNDAMGGDWMSNPLVWVVGALVLIVIIALVARGGGNK